MSAPPSSSPGSHREHLLPVEALQERLRSLLHEREQLRNAGAREDLERNRSQIVAVQWAISRALVSRYAV